MRSAVILFWCLLVVILAWGGRGNQHVDMIWHQVTFQNRYSFVLTKTLQNFLYTIAQLSKYYFSTILRREHDMILAQPICVSKTLNLGSHNKNTLL